MAEERLGQVVGGRYVLESVVQACPEQATYRAFNLDLELPVTLTIIWEPSLSAQGIRRFRTEARVLARLQHPNIVELLDCGQLECDTPFTVLPVLDGETLADALAHGPLSAEMTVHLLAEVARALSFSHQFNVFHLALTPASVFLGQRPQVFDFLGSRWHQIDDQFPVVREIHTAAPEVLRGGTPTPAADVYALGHLGYACLVGALPTEHLDPLDAEAQHLAARPWSLPDEVQVPSDLADIIARSMEKRVEARIPTCDALLAEFERWQASTASTQRLTAVKPRPFFPSVGDVVARKYVVEDIIGQGGFARVFRAKSTDTGKSIALKILRPDRKRDTPEARRFEREGELVFSLLKNPHTISVYGYGETEKGLLYIAFEFIDGITLSSAVAAGPLGPERVVRILEQCLASLAEAHGMGVLHRDIKPSNVMLSHRDGVHDWATVLDFGVAKITSDIMDPRELTVAGTAVGTPRYMSPEQIVGDTLGPESDLYALGLVAYELLTGEPGITGKSVLEILAAQVDPQSVMLPSSSNVPVPLALIVNRMLRKERRSRYLAAHDVLADLRQLERDAADRTLDTGPRR